MKVLIDIGNTRGKLVFVEQGQLSDIVSLDVKALNKTWFEQQIPGLEACFLASVKQTQVVADIEAWCHQLNIPFLQIETEQEKFGVRCSYQKPSTYGVDRWLTLLAAQKLYPQSPCLIVDSGTATTIDLLSASGQHLGGWILPGIELLISSLLTNTSKVSADVVAIENIDFATNTSDAVNQAAWAATLGMINEAVAKIKSDKKITMDSLQVIFTGGNGERLSQLFSGESHFQEKLIFVGMQRYI